jgi:ABC-type lipoprotein export system ATPase subunit
VDDLIVARDLTKTYSGGDVAVHALRGVTVTVRQGEFVAVVGPSGSGKSTLMHVLGCLDRPDGGTYLLDDIDVGRLDVDALAEIRNRKIGFVFQSFNLLPRATVLENVELPLYYRPDGDVGDGAAREMLRLVGLAGKERRVPTQLSGGEQQRVAIARALVNRPAMILADEPTGNLDTGTSEEIMGLFAHLNRERDVTVLVVTHEADIAARARRRLTVRDGRLVADTGEARGRR